MRKFLVLAISLIMVLSFAACGNNNGGTSENKGGSGSATVSKPVSSSAGAFNADEVEKNLATTTYTWNDSSTYYAAIVVKNNSAMDCALTANIIFKDENGQTIGTDNATIYAFEKGTETCFVVSNEDAFASFDYTYEASKTSMYKAATSSLSCETSTTSNKAILTFTNNGSEEISGGYTVLFMLGDIVVERGIGFISNLAPGATKADESRFWNTKKDFDNVKVYYHGYILDI